MYKRCASGLVDKSRDDEEFAEFVRQKFTRTPSQHSYETTPARKRCRVDIHSSETPPENSDAIPTFEQLMLASPIRQEAASLSIMDEKEVGNIVQNRKSVGKGGATPKRKAKGDSYTVVDSLWQTGWHLPPKFSTPTKLGCSKCRWVSIGCGRCRGKKKLKLSFRIFDADGRVELVWTKCK